MRPFPPLPGLLVFALWIGAEIVAPGFVAGAVGLALLTPSFRRWLVARSGTGPVNPREIELSAKEWREVSGRGAKRLRRGKVEPD